MQVRKVPGLGPRNPKVANSAVWALSRLDGEEAVAQLARLAARVTFKGTLKEVGAALDTRAAQKLTRAGLRGGSGPPHSSCWRR